MESCDTLSVSPSLQIANSRCNPPAIYGDTKDRAGMTTSRPLDHLSRAQPPGPHASIIGARHYEVVAQIYGNRPDELGVSFDATQ